MSLERRTPLPRSTINPRRPTPRRRDAPRWNPQEWQEANIALMSRSGGLCDACGSPLAGQVERHHRQRRQVGGDRLSNILALHSAHHKWVTEHPEQARASGLIVSMNADPMLTPVLWHGVVWKLLDDSGGMTSVDAPKVC